MRKTSTILLSAAALVLPVTAAAQTGQGTRDPRVVRVQPRVVIEQQRERQRAVEAREEQSEKISRTFRIGGSGELEVSNLSGDITITRGSGNELQIEAIKIARARTAEEARQMLPLVKVDFTERGNLVETRAIYTRPEEEGKRVEAGRHPLHRNINVSVVYNITAPAGTRIEARSLSGNIRVTDIKGELSAVSTSGHVVISNAGRVSTAKSRSGHVEIVNTTSEIPLEAESMSGNVTVRQVKAPSMELVTISGKVVITDVDVRRIEAQSLTGGVDFSSAFAKGGRYELNSHAGTVRITVSGGSGFEVDANTFAGSIQVDPSFNLKKEEEGSETTRRRQRSLRGVVGDGGALIDVTTFSGSVVITRK
jgi:DUF4097 and DUF4098 domain-containing protein YvlB